MEIGVFPDCNVHRNLAYAVQQIIAQELEVERLKRASILTGLGGVNSENMKNPRKSEIIENVQNNSSNTPNNTKQSGKNASLKEIVSFTCASLFIVNFIIFNNFRCTKTFSEISLI